MSQASSRLQWLPVVCVLATLVGCGGSRFANYMHRGEDYLDHGALDKARVEFRNALQIQPRDPRARYLNGVVAEKLGRMRDALGYYQGAIEVNPDYPDARAAAGRVLVFGGATERALPIVEAGLAKHPDDAKLLTVRAGARLRASDEEGALADAEHAVRSAPDDPDAVALLAALYQRRGDTARATDILVSAVGRQPVSLDLRQVLANLYLQTGQPARSEEQLKAIVALAPKEIAHRLRLAAFYQATNNLDAAQGTFEQAVAAFPRNDQAKVVLVDFLLRQRDRAAGEKRLHSYLDAEPDNDSLRLELAALLQRAGAGEQAVTAYQQIVARDPKSAAALTARDRLASLDIANGHPEAAQNLIAVVLEQSPRDADALLMRAQIALAANNPAAAIADLRAFLRDQPSAANVQRILARAYLVSGDTTLAEETLRSAVQAPGSDTAVRLELAQLLSQLHRTDDAVRLLEDTVTHAPTEVAAREALVQAYLAKHDLASARTAAEDLKTLKPDAAAGHYLAGLVAQRDGRIDDSQRELQRALEMQPDAIDACAALTKLDLGRGRTAPAVARVRALVARHPNDVYALNLLGETLAATRAVPEAVGTFRQVIELAPNWSLPYHNLAFAQLASQDGAGAIATYQSGVRKTSGDVQLCAELASLYERQGSVDAAIRQYEDIHARYPHLDGATNNLAMLLVNYRTDRPSLDRARDLTAPFASSTSGEFLDTHGWVRLKLGDVTNALPALERAMARVPDSSVIHYHLAMAELKAGQRDKARSNLEAALSSSERFNGRDDAHAALASLVAGSRS